MAYGSGGFLCLVSVFCRCRTVFETIAVIAGFDDVAMVGQAVELGSEAYQLPSDLKLIVGLRKDSSKQSVVFDFDFRDD